MEILPRNFKEPDRMAAQEKIIQTVMANPHSFLLQYWLVGEPVDDRVFFYAVGDNHIGRRQDGRDYKDVLRSPGIPDNAAKKSSDYRKTVVDGHAGRERRRDILRSDCNRL